MNELIAALLLSLPLAQAPDDRIICVPRADGAGWDCGKGTAAPAASPQPPSAPRSAAPAEPPPLYLIDPAQMPRIVRESIERGDYATAEAASEHLPAAPRVVRSADEPDAAAAQAPATPAAPPSAPPPAAPAAAAAAPEPVAVEPAPVVAAPAGPAPVVDEAAPPAAPATETPVPAALAAETPAAPDVAAPAPVSASAATEAPPAAPSAAELAQRPPRSVSSSARDASELLALAPSAYTIQLAAARSFQGFTAFRQKLGVAVEDTFVIKVRRNGEDWWLMLWRDFADLESARSAAAGLPGGGSFWPRRLAPLQAEVRAAD